MYCSVHEKNSAIVVPEQQNISLLGSFCSCGIRTAEYWSGEKHSTTVVTEEQNISLVRNILLLW